MNHAELTSAIVPSAPEVQALMPMMQALPGGSAPGVLGGMINIQALMISYLNNFMGMMWVTLAAMPLVLLLRRPGQKPGAALAAHMV